MPLLSISKTLSVNSREVLKNNARVYSCTFPALEEEDGGTDRQEDEAVSSQS